MFTVSTSKILLIQASNSNSYETGHVGVKHLDVGQKEDFVISSGLCWQPMQRHQDRCYMIKLW